MNNNIFSELYDSFCRATISVGLPYPAEPSTRWMTHVTFLRFQDCKNFRGVVSWCSLEAGMKLREGQIWKTAEEYVKIKVWQRMQIEYLVSPTAEFFDGEPTWVSKKEFCRLLKGAELFFEPGH